MENFWNETQIKAPTPQSQKSEINLRVLGANILSIQSQIYNLDKKVNTLLEMGNQDNKSTNTLTSSEGMFLIIIIKPLSKISIKSKIQS